jgi:hypothetical protein
MVDGNVKPVEFVYKGKYEKERSVVYSSLTVRSSACRPVTLRSWPPGEIDYIVDDQPESATPEPSVTDNGKSPKTEDTAGQDDPFDPSWHPEPRMGISLEDLNSDGKEDILACFEHWAWGEGCHFYVFINCGEGRWKRVHYGTTYDRIFLSNTEHMRLKDIVFEGHCRSRRKLDLSREACGETRMCQFDGQQYRSVVLAEMHHDWAIGVKTISIRVVAGKGMNPGVVDLR